MGWEPGAESRERRGAAPGLGVQCCVPACSVLLQTGFSRVSLSVCGVWCACGAVGDTMRFRIDMRRAAPREKNREIPRNLAPWARNFCETFSTLGQEIPARGKCARASSSRRRSNSSRRGSRAPRVARERLAAAAGPSFKWVDRLRRLSSCQIIVPRSMLLDQAVRSSFSDTRVRRVIICRSGS